MSGREDRKAELDKKAKLKSAARELGQELLATTPEIQKQATDLKLRLERLTFNPNDPNGPKDPNHLYALTLLCRDVKRFFKKTGGQALSQDERFVKDFQDVLIASCESSRG